MSALVPVNDSGLDEVDDVGIALLQRRFGFQVIGEVSLVLRTRTQTTFAYRVVPLVLGIGKKHPSSERVTTDYLPAGHLSRPYGLSCPNLLVAVLSITADRGDLPGYPRQEAVTVKVVVMVMVFGIGIIIMMESKNQDGQNRGQHPLEFLPSFPHSSRLEQFMHRIRLIQTARLATVPRYQLPSTPVGVERIREMRWKAHDVF
jgi:hypothetical protein